MADNNQRRDNPELDEKAFEIYKQLSMRSGLSEESLVVQSYRKAQAFLETSAKIRSGKVQTQPVEVVPSTVKVPRVRAKNEGAGWDQILDPLTKKPLMEEAPVDHFSFAPNLPADHPINLRFQPLDGVSFEDRRELCRASISN